jgi:hypothetical protein
MTRRRLLPLARRASGHAGCARSQLVSMKEGGLSSQESDPSDVPCYLPGERRRVKRLSKLTEVNVGWLMALDAAA